MELYRIPVHNVDYNSGVYYVHIIIIYDLCPVTSAHYVNVHIIISYKSRKSILLCIEVGRLLVAPVYAHAHVAETNPKNNVVLFDNVRVCVPSTFHI